MNYSELAKVIVTKIGGEQNVNSLTHCATRLRFHLKDNKLAETSALKNTPGVMGVTQSGGQYQIIIGSDVGSVYKEIIQQIPSLQTEHTQISKDDDDRKLVAKVIDTITGIFTPILPAITAAGMLKAVLALLVVFKVFSTDSQSYQIINLMADSAFYFLPILLAISSAQKFKTNIYLAAMIGGVLLHPAFVQMVATSKETGEAIQLLGLPISPVNYSSTVIPIILSIWFMSYVEPIADKVSPKAIKFFSKPLLTIAIVGTIALTVLGPVGFYISNLISSGVLALESVGSWIVPTLLGALTPLLVATGTHYGIVPIGINNRLTNGYDTIVYPGMLASNIAQGAASVAVGIKSKDSKIKQLASSAGLTALFGITEPALYGVNLRYKTPLYAAMIGGGFSGLFMGITGVRNFSGGSPGLLTLPSYIGEDTLRHLTNASIGAAIAFVITFAVTMVIYKDPIEEMVVENVEKDQPELKILSGNNETLVSPLVGQAVSLTEVPDEMFSAEILGKGVAIKPSEGLVVSPFSGTITATFDTKHAIGITSDQGTELLIHVGIDTVQLNGEGYECFVEKGDHVETGDSLIQFDLKEINRKEFETITPIVITNSNEYGDIISIEGKEVAIGDKLLQVIR
ncbi:PTS system beta-glucoside-specific EIIBCA component [Jeotgalibaca dankookensis]|uniref:PTS system sucrose-specific EIIBCA component n=1 Tax=Jeotgalibaca dankookensis TaxID=708126 RepID=A0A1S6IML1_9LACT|nr:beta-glucoside-specific PTS transporter subunit IIABC [Jeotgalibaca dankookensis]AQS52776.1 PTS system beta-glucoside-specific EIIBCA component [Jeotgalibaca dankookensis]